MPLDKRSGPEGPPHLAAAKQANSSIVPRASAGWPFEASGDHADLERAYQAPPFEGLTELHARAYRMLHGYSHTGSGGYPVARINQRKAAAKLGVSVRTFGKLIADMRTPEPDPRKPHAKPTGRRWGWLHVVPRDQRKSRKGGAPILVGNDYVLLLSWAEVASFAAAPNRSAPKRAEPIGTSLEGPNRSAASEGAVSAGGTDRHERLRADQGPPTVRKPPALRPDGTGQPVSTNDPAATYRLARGRVVDLERASLADFHRAVDQLDRHTCTDGSPCQPGRSCRRHTWTKRRPA